jgi:hypothetical protein
MKLSTSALALFSGIAAAVPTVQDSPPNGVTINSINYGGSGCPQGTVSQFISDDRTTFTLIFDQYIANVGPGTNIADARKNCQINVDFHYPGGYQFSIYKQDYRGYVKLDNGVNGLQKSTFYFSGTENQVSTSTNFAGPMDKDYLITDTVPFDSTVWSPCGKDGALNINTQVRVDNSGRSGGQGQLTTDSIDGKVSFVFGMSWRKC